MLFPFESLNLNTPSKSLPQVLIVTNCSWWLGKRKTMTSLLEILPSNLSPQLTSWCSTNKQKRQNWPEKSKILQHFQVNKQNCKMLLNLTKFFETTWMTRKLMKSWKISTFLAYWNKVHTKTLAVDTIKMCTFLSVNTSLVTVVHVLTLRGPLNTILNLHQEILCIVLKRLSVR